MLYIHSILGELEDTIWYLACENLSYGGRLQPNTVIANITNISGRGWQALSAVS